MIGPFDSTTSQPRGLSTASSNHRHRHNIMLLPSWSLLVNILLFVLGCPTSLPFLSSRYTQYTAELVVSYRCVVGSLQIRETHSDINCVAEATASSAAAHALRRQRRILLSTLRGDCSVMIVINTLIFAFAVVSLRFILAPRHADPFSNDVSILILISSMDGVWVSILYFFSVNEALRSGDDHHTALHWVSSICRRVNQEVSHTSALFTTPATSTIRSLMFLIVSLGSLTPAPFTIGAIPKIFGMLDYAFGVIPTRLLGTGPIAISMYAAFILVRSAIFARIFTSLEAVEECGKVKLDDHMAIVPVSMRAIAQPVSVVVEHV